MIERIDELRTRGRGGDRRGRLAPPRSRSCACASSAARPSCRTCCAASPSCRPSERGAGRQGRQRGAPGARGADRRARAAELEARGARRAAGRRPRRRHAARRRRRSPVGRLHLLTATRREIEDVFVGLGFRVVEGPEVETVHYNFDALNHDAAHPARGAQSDTFYVADDVVLRTHTSPMQIRAMEAQPPPLYDRHPRARLPARQRRARTRRSSTRSRAWRSTRTSRSPTSRARCWRSRARSSATSARCACARTSSRSPSRASRSTSRCFQCDGKGFLRDGSRCPLCKGEGWIEILGAGDGRPERVRLRARPRLRPRAVQGFAFGMGIERIAMLKHGVPDLRLLLRERPALPGAVRLMLRPVDWLHDYADAGPADVASSRSA